MVKFPNGFVALKYPGYFWNTNDEKLYSMKVTGVLRPLRFYQGGFFNGVQVPGCYQISVNGIRKYISLDQIAKMTSNESTIPVGV